jgi:NADH-quinone oxidoreductase subunit M
MYLLISFLFISFLFINFLFFFNNWYRLFSFYFFFVNLLSIIFIFVVFDKAVFWFQLICEFYRFQNLNITYILGVDFLSLILILLSSFLLLCCFLINWNLKYLQRYYIFLLLFTLLLFINVFLSLDFFYFFIFFEAIVIPMFLFVEFEVVECVKFMLLINYLFILFWVLCLF